MEAGCEFQFFEVIGTNVLAKNEVGFNLFPLCVCESSIMNPILSPFSNVSYLVHLIKQVLLLIRFPMPLFPLDMA